MHRGVQAQPTLEVPRLEQQGLFLSIQPAKQKVMNSPRIRVSTILVHSINNLEMWKTEMAINVQNPAEALTSHT